MADLTRTEVRDGVRLIRMDFGSANALGPRAAADLIAALEGDSRPTVLTGSGAVFSAGLNLVELDPLARDELTAFVERFSVLMMQVLTTSYPLVAAVNGHAVAGGCVLAMACDHRVGTAGNFKIGMNEMALHLTLPAVVTEILRGKLTTEHARTVILGGALYDPQAASEVGLLDEVATSAEQAIDRACDVARQLGRSGPEFAAMKGSLVAPITAKFRETRSALDHRFVESWYGEAATRMRRDALQRMRERRTE